MNAMQSIARKPVATLNILVAGSGTRQFRSNEQQGESRNLHGKNTGRSFLRWISLTVLAPVFTALFVDESALLYASGLGLLAAFMWAAEWIDLASTPRERERVSPRLVADRAGSKPTG
ncbi:MAG: hypothetical protein ACT4PZ_24660 [Panacagrimonas sp.]